MRLSALNSDFFSSHKLTLQTLWKFTSTTAIFVFSTFLSKGRNLLLQKPGLPLCSHWCLSLVPIPTISLFSSPPFLSMGSLLFTILMPSLLLVYHIWVLTFKLLGSVVCILTSFSYLPFLHFTKICLLSSAYHWNCSCKRSNYQVQSITLNPCAICSLCNI